MKRILSLTVLTLGLSLSASGADFPEGAVKPFQFNLGGSWNSFDTQARLDVTRGGVVTAGTTVDFEKLLDIPVMDQNFIVTGQWRFSRVSYVQAGFQSMKRAGTRLATEEIRWDDATYGVGVQIDGNFDSTEVYLGYRWDAFKADNVRLGMTIGVSYYEIASGLLGAATVTYPDGSIKSEIASKGFDVKLPVPVIGLVGEGAISSQFTFNFYARALFINTGDFSGGTVAGGITFKWYFMENLGLGAGADITSLQIKKYVDDQNTWSARYSFSGPKLFVIAAF